MDKKDTIYKFIYGGLLTFILLCGTNLFQYENWDYVIGGRLNWLFDIILIAVLAYSFSLSDFIKKPLNWIPIILICLVLPCAVVKQIVFGESMLSERFYIRDFLAFLMFFVFYKYKAEEDVLIRILYCLSFIIFVIQIYQILFPENAVFGVYTYDQLLNNNYSQYDIAETRNGIHRFRLECYFITMLSLFHSWQRLLEKFSIANLLIFLVFLISDYLFLTRQILAVTLLGLAVSPLIVMNKNKGDKKDKKVSSWYIILGLLFILLIVLYNFRDLIFKEMVEMTMDDMSSSNIRIACVVFYVTQIISHPLGLIFGHGHLSEVSQWEFYYKYFPEDIGFIGEAFYYGIIYVIFYFVCLGFLLGKFRKYLPVYIQLYLISTALTSVMIFPYRTLYEFGIWTVVLYISSVHIANAKNLKI